MDTKTGIKRIEILAPDGAAVTVILDDEAPGGVRLEPPDRYLWHRDTNRPGVLRLEPVAATWHIELAIEYQCGWADPVNVAALMDGVTR